MKKNMQLARQLNEIHEQWARDNGYRPKRQAASSKQQATSNEELEGLKKYVKEKKKPI